MPSWLARFYPPRHPQCSDHDTNRRSSLHFSINDKSQDSTKSGMPTPDTSTAVDHHILPPPVLQPPDNHRSKPKPPRIGFSAYWASLKRQLGVGGPPPSSSSFLGDSAGEDSFVKREFHLLHRRPPQPRHQQQREQQEHQQKKVEDENREVNEVVVDRIWSEDVRLSESASDNGGLNNSDNDSITAGRWWKIWKPFVILRYRFYPTLREFFFTRFEDENSESHYSQEDWILKKPLAVWAALWLVVNWILGVAFIDKNPRGFDRGDIIFYFVVGPLLAFPVLWMVIYDWPKSRPVSYQLFLVIAIWAWGFYFVLFIKICGFYPDPRNPVITSCQNRDFLGLFYYTTALQVMGLFGLKLNRLLAAIGAVSFFIMTSTLMIPAKASWARNMINFFVFHFFLIYVHYMRENSERRLYTLRYQLKIQYKATQKAQVNERRAADSKRRLTSYVFHDKVPLNTALLAVQNMEASGNIAKDQEIEFDALAGSLSMMSKVLNDVLDFNKMDSGTFESATRPYSFHQTMRSLIVPLRLATDARGLDLEIEFDRNIDIIARKAAYEVLGENIENIRRHIESSPEVDGVVTGDEVRLRQIITNLASNACKFTPTGGKLTIRTRLIMPSIPPDAHLLGPRLGPDDSEEHRRNPLSASNLSKHDNEQVAEGKSKTGSRSNSQKDAYTHRTGPRKHAVRGSEMIVVRIELTDTGCGIKAGEMSKLFTAFTQTEQGRQQGGKGTGLGLALVRQIVKLSGGRLGVRSKVGQGSTFWVELPLGIGRETFIARNPPSLDPGMSQGSSRLNYGHDHNLAAMPHGMNYATDLASEIAGTRINGRAKGKTRILSRTDSVMHRLMEQGGRVELVLKKRTQPKGEEDNSSTMKEKVEDDSNIAQQPRSSSPSRQETDVANTDQVDPKPETSEANEIKLGVKTRNIQRPTFVQLPAPRTFSPETQLPLNTPSPRSSHSASSNSPLAMFDAVHTRGTPSSVNTAMNFETTPGMSVLVVDDDALTRTLMKRILNRLGCKVTLAENGLIALEMILGEKIKGRASGTPASTPSSVYSRNGDKPILEQQVEETTVPDPETPTVDGLGGQKYAVIFLDNQMPVMSGLKVVAHLRQLGRNDFVVGVTGNALLTDQQEYLSAGVDRVLTKPVLERSLREVLQMAEERQKSENPDSAAASPT